MTKKAHKSLIRDMEERVARLTIETLLEAGFYISVDDGEETTLEKSADNSAVYHAMFTTDEDYLIVYACPGRWQRVGYVRFVYGNDGWDVINDYTTDLETVLQPVWDLIEPYG